MDIRTPPRDGADATLLVLQHIACEPPAAYEDEMRAWGVGLHRVEVDEGQALPDWRGFDGIVAMGGPMAAYDDATLPWLAPEKQLIAEAVRAGLPYWGVCLGAQLLAASLGAAVFSGPLPEVGVLPVQLTDEGRRDPVFGVLPDDFPALQWHGDTYEPPVGAVRLAGSESYEQQAFVIGRAYGIQFHLEVPVSLADQWADVPAYADSLAALPTPMAAARLLEQIAEHADEMTSRARRLFAAWLEHVVGLPRQEAPEAVRAIARAPRSSSPPR